MPLSASLLTTGYHLKSGDDAHVRQLKFTIGLDNLPWSAHLFTEQKYTSGNAALREVLLSSLNSQQPDTIKIFDKGITSRKTYDDLTGKGVRFISRMGKQSKHKEHQLNSLPEPVNTAVLTILSDS